ncbi:hypothetical protein MBRA1_001584 [Malassezia brasiliensis]|uniref:Gfo/Idh/MocA-like oxidoreductase N-terminal domain-containing protein n=1 Tax=Malassezia brasiliensis TaxID=1821822 RepID=A0AAF0DUC1_9BASI|nr:hypothetical protein MBRA1_001584 [Malassezia brasiliensis]
MSETKNTVPDFEHVETAMYRQEPPEPGEDFLLAIVGAGNINFGSDEGPWNHSFRLEHKLGPRLKVVALIDPAKERAEEVLEAKRKSFVVSAYKDTVIYADIEDYLKAITPETRPHAIWVGSPPAFRGRLEKGRNLEVLVADNLPKTAMFIEKPVTTGPVEEAAEVAHDIKKRGNLVSVGYMLRYLKVVQKMKQIIDENNLVVTAVNGRYVMAYEYLSKSWWWNKKQSLGPVIEQATHFCDLARYFGGEVDLSTVFAHSLEHNEPAGKLHKLNVDEEAIPPEDRIPRVTSATWKYESGAVGSLMHCVALHGQDFFTHLDVFADGYYLRLVDPYHAPTLYVRRPGDDHEETYRYSEDDPFFSEVSNLVDCIQHGPNAAPILSTYEDAVKTYALTWAIRLASEKRVDELAKLAKIQI